MPFQRYPLATVQKVSQFIRTTLTLPPHEQQPGAAAEDDSDADGPLPDSLDSLGDLFRVGDLPEDNLPAPNLEGRWFVSTTDPAEALVKLPGLWLRPGVRLVTYLRQDTQGRAAATVALPERLSTTEYLEAAIAQIPQPDQPPSPMGALPNLMASIDGNGSLASFLVASIFAREAREFGRSGRYARWVHHRFVTAPPPQIPWQWRTTPPQDLSPKLVLRPNNEVLVEFYSCRVQKTIALFRHLDRYPPSSYIAESRDQVVAVAGAAG